MLLVAMVKEVLVVLAAAAERVRRRVMRELRGGTPRSPRPVCRALVAALEGTGLRRVAQVVQAGLRQMDL